MSHGLKRGVFESLGLHCKSGKSCEERQRYRRVNRTSEEGWAVYMNARLRFVGWVGEGGGEVRGFVKRSLFPRGGGG